MWDGLENQTSQHRLTAPPVYMDDTPEDFMMIEHDENSRISRWLDEEDALLDNPMLMTTTATIEQEDSSFLNSPINNENNGGYVTGGKNSIYGRKALQNINANTAQQQDIQLQKQASAIAKTQVLPMLQHRDIPSGAGTFIEPTHNNINLRSVDEIPMIYRSIFKFKTFNLMQSACMDIALYTQSNFVVSAPTGAGKTGVLELAILRALMDGKGGSKIIYMAPTKSLCSERANDWEKKFQSLGISCKEFTGDTDHTSLDAIKKSDIIVTTPEKWDSMTRRWVDYKDLMKFITLFIMDEVHILNERRGAVLEACVSRMKTMEHAVRYVAVSATVPNLQDIAEWLGGAALSFSEDFRPVQLERVVYGIPFYGDSMFSFESKMDWKLFDMIQKHSKGKPVLIFCSTRKSAQSSCEVLLKLMDKKNIQSLGTSNMTIDITNVKDKKLTEFLQKGIGFHHAGLESSDRQLVEQLFTQRKIRIVSTTSTLALGVNLPAHLVIIKSTKTYQNGALVDYSDIELLQMIGRAGRPGLEDSGCAVILTTPDMEQRYRTIMCGSSQIESCLHGNLVEHMMTEICLGTVTDIETCIKWLQSTFLYIRIKKNPSRYMIDQDATYSPQTLTPSHVLHGICKKNINMLTESELAINSETNHGIKALKATAYGIAMDRYCIRLETMVTILKSENCVSIKDVLSLVSLAKEFEAMRFTVGEKPFLNSLQNNVNIRFPIQGKVATISDKIFLVIQCVLGDISLHTNIMGSSLVFSSFQILLFASRIAKCIIDCCIYNQDVICLKHTLDLYRSIQAKMWASSPYPLRQIDKIGPKMAKTLAKAGISTFDQLRSVDAARIEVVLHRNPPFGNQIKEALGIIPLFIMDVQYSMSPKQPTEVILKISVSVSNTKKIPRKRYGKGFYAQVWIEADKTFIDFRRTSIQNLQERQRFFTVRAKLPNPSTNITCHVQSEDYIGADISKTIHVEVDPTLFPKQNSVSSPYVSSTHDNQTGSSSRWQQNDHITELEDNEKTHDFGSNDSNTLDANGSKTMDPYGFDDDNDSEDDVPLLYVTQNNKKSRTVSSSPSSSSLVKGKGRGQDRSGVVISSTRANPQKRRATDDQQEMTSYSNRKKKPRTTECKHTCRDKNSCKHACCKISVSPATATTHTNVKNGVMIYNDSWNDSPIELLSDTTIAQPNLVGEQLGASTSIVGDDIFFVSGSLQSEQQRQHHSSSVSLSKTYSKMPAFTFSDGEQRSLTSVVKNKSITNVPSSSSINVRSSQTISDDLFWGEDDDEWTRLAVQATENAERALVNKPASSSALAPPRAGVLPTKYASSFSSVNNVPSMISEQDDPEDPLDPLWEEIGKYAYHAFKNHTLKNEPPRPIITPSYPLSHRVVPATTPTTEENKFKTYSLKYWLDTHVIVIDDEDMKS